MGVVVAVTSILALTVLPLLGGSAHGLSSGDVQTPGDTSPTGPGDGSSGPFSVNVEGTAVSVQVSGTPNYQARVEDAADTILATGLLDASGTTTMVFDLAPGEHEIEVILFDPVGAPTPLGTRIVTVAGPPPPPPTVEVTPAKPEDSRTLLRVTGPPGSNYRAEIVREGESGGVESGELDGEGVGIVTFLLENGPWGYVVTLSNGSGASEPALGEFEVAVGPPTPPALAILSDKGANPVTVGIIGPAGGHVTVTATSDGDEVIEEAELGKDAVAEVDLRLPHDGHWKITGVSTDLQGQESGSYKIPGGVMLTSEGPPLEVKPISAGEGEFGFKIITEPGAQVRVDSETEALRMEFTAEEEETEFKIKVPEGEHIIEVHATASGADTIDTLSSTEKPGGGFPTMFVLLILFLLVLFGGVAFVKRQEIIDEYHTRQYR